MSEEKHDPGPPDPAAFAERSRRIVGESEQLIENLSLDPEARREFEEVREQHVAAIARLAEGDVPALVKACLHYLTRLGQIAVRNRGRGRGRAGERK